jgi:hypothetical protein
MYFPQFLPKSLDFLLVSLRILVKKMKFSSLSLFVYSYRVEEKKTHPLFMLFLG